MTSLIKYAGLQSVEEHLWRHRDKYAAQLDDRLTLRKLLLDNNDTIQLVVAIRLREPARSAVLVHTLLPDSMHSLLHICCSFACVGWC